jgi:DNA-binding CsgD family transcriptional regulator
MRVQRPGLTELVGRASELAAFPQFLDAVAQGPAALVLEGDAGIGKTVLWAAAARLAEERGYRVFSSRPTEAETQLPFAALGDLLDKVPEDALAGLPEPQRRALDVAMLRAEWDGRAIERRAASLAVLTALRRLADETPVILALDDVQWLDAPSAAALQFVLRRLEQERVGLLATQRGRGGAFPAGLAEAFPPDRLQRFEVGPLDRGSLSRLLLARLREPISAPTIVQLHRISAGNPFLALEIAAALERRGVVLEPGGAFPVPANLRELVRDRVQGLPTAARDAALAVAALAQATIEQVEAAVVGEGADVDGLGLALAADIVEIEGKRVRFTHPLLGSIIYSEASPARRRALHGHLAALTDDSEERARHLALSTQGPDTTVAAVIDEAALDAIGRGAPETAADLYDHAIRLTSADDQLARYRRTIDAAEARLHAGQVPAARLTFLAASEAAPEGRARAHALTRLASMLIFDWQPDISVALETYEHARREADNDPTLVGAIELDLAWLNLFRGDRLASSLHAKHCVELAEETSDKERLARALVTRAMMDGRAGDEKALGFLERAFALEEHVRHRQFTDRPQFVHALFLAGDGRLDEARAIVVGEYRRALERGDESSLPTLLECLTIIERRVGNWDEAERYAREMHAMAEREVLIPTYHSGPYALILALRGHAEHARALAEQDLVIADAGGIGPIFGGHRAVLGFVALSLGDAGACADLLEPLSAMLTPEIGEHGWFRFIADEIEARVALGELERADELVERLAERRSVLHDRAWARAATERCRGLLFAAAAQEERANDAFASALREHEQLHEPFELARTLLGLGRAQRRFKRRRSAREHLTRAREIFSELGAPLWVARADEDLRRIGGRAPREGGLTPTEERVAGLAADGLTNREIAAALYLSVNTVQAYLKRIYRELGIRSRTELGRKLPPDRDSKCTDSGVSGSESPS